MPCQLGKILRKLVKTLIKSVSRACTDLVQENRHYIKCVAEVLFFTVTDHRKSESGDHQGNFLAILELAAVEKKIQWVA